jgi:hypothetical protein
MTTEDFPASDFWHELKAIKAESIGWQPLGEGAYLHVGNPGDEEVITVVGIPDASMTALNVLLLGW